MKLSMLRTVKIKNVWKGNDVSHELLKTGALENQMIAYYLLMHKSFRLEGISWLKKVQVIYIKYIAWDDLSL